ncbi:polyprenyl synthetase family protein [Candidatus Deianiraea vastatrix]|uniref:Farnesyl diphosphate synthase n=1 Tax=Candidatus Deianiraea vastatrix TaxID=2163644 RepID=A0A5B8XHP2_9RICK|nr:polyprenyl synthetase family protein [Candidatus Deianiraea vastatrix]QED23634.1 Farnesyl diphosphate synthase [Candidatus Deianiraea vastatrix]
MQKDFTALQKYISDCATRINQQLSKTLAFDENDPIAKLLNAMQYSVLAPDAKRFRPFLLVATSDLLEINRDISIKYASIVELIHCYSLVHDDLPALDNDDYRRGKPTCHKAFDEATAILTGDALLTKAFQIASEINDPIDPTIQLQIINIIANAASTKGLIGGQFIDITSSPNNIQEAMRMNAMKTGALFKVCCEIPIALAAKKISKNHARHITLYSQSIGAAFQIIDDIHDCIEDSTKKKDQSNIVSIVGVDQAKNEAQILINQAIDMMSIFESKKATVLIEFAKYIHSRIL